MNAKQMIAIVIVMMTVLPGINVIANQDLDLKRTGTEDDVVELDGSILAKISGRWLVCPSINISNGQILEFDAIKKGENEYSIKSILKINVNATGNTVRKSLLGKFLLVRISIVRENRRILPLRGIRTRWYVGKPLILRRINLLSEGEKYLEIPLEYTANCVSENVTMRIFVRGFPFFEFKKIDLKLVYLKSDVKDVTPPVTTCELEGKKI